MNKMQFLAMSLPHGLRMMFEKSGRIICLNGLEILGINDCIYVDKDKYISSIYNFKPILHQLSDLTKEIEHKGEMFVPIEYLSMYANEQTESGKSGLEWGITSSFPFLDILKLIEWHFDICDLIEKGEAIDVNSLSENPYK